MRVSHGSAFAIAGHYEEYKEEYRESGDNQEGGEQHVRQQEEEGETAAGIDMMSEEEYFARLRDLIASDPGRGQHTCKICQQSSSTLQVIKTHVEGMHLKLGRYVCRFCGKPNHTRVQMNMHINSKHREQNLLERSFGDTLPKKRQQY